MVKSVLGKLIQREFGKERYACYADKLKRKQSMDVFCSYGAYACFFTASCGGVCHNSSDRRTYFFV